MNMRSGLHAASASLLVSGNFGKVGSSCCFWSETKRRKTGRAFHRSTPAASQLLVLVHRDSYLQNHCCSQVCPTRTTDNNTLPGLRKRRVHLLDQPGTVHGSGSCQNELNGLNKTQRRLLHTQEHTQLHSSIMHNNIHNITKVSPAHSAKGR